MRAAAVFLDKDGTVVPDIPYNVDPTRLSLSYGAVAGLRLLQHHGFSLILVSNQSGIAHGFFSWNALAIVERRLRRLLIDKDIALDGYYYCPHHPQGKLPEYTGKCGCRKPQPGMLLHAAEEHNIDLSVSWMIGDILDDVEAGHRAGCRTVLLLNGGESEWVFSDVRTPDLYASNLGTAAARIVDVAITEGVIPSELVEN